MSALAVGKISEASGGFHGSLTDEDSFGIACSGIGDLDGDCVPDLVVGAERSNHGGPNRGTAWILFLDQEGSVTRQRELGFAGGVPLQDFDFFGRAVASLGDLDGDGIQDVAVGAYSDQDCGGGFGLSGCGAVWILFLNRDGSIKSHSKISSTQGGFTGQLDDSDAFGLALAAIGDLDQDGVVDIAVGALHDDDGPLGAIDTGAVWVLFLNADGTVKTHQKISSTQGGLAVLWNDFDQFGVSLGFLGDLDQDGAPELAVGATDGGQGSVTVLSLNPDGTVLRHQKIGLNEGGFQGDLQAYDVFGSAVCSAGDLDGDGVDELLVGAAGDSGGSFHGGVWLLYMNEDATVRRERKVASASNLSLDADDLLGIGLGSIDLDRDGELEVFVGAPGDDDGGLNHGALWRLELLEGSVRHSSTPPPQIRIPMRSDSGEGFLLRLEPRGEPDVGAIPFVQVRLAAPRFAAIGGSWLDAAVLLRGDPYQGVPADVPLPDDPRIVGLRLAARGVYVSSRGAGAGGAVVGADVRLVAECHGHR